MGVAKRDKRIAAMRQNRKNVRPDELDTVLIAAGFAARQQGTSHKVYSHGSYVLPVPQRKPYLLPIYVTQALTLLDAISADEAVADDGDTDTAAKDE